MQTYQSCKALNKQYTCTKFWSQFIDRMPSAFAAELLETCKV